MGGAVSRLYASEYPEEVSGLVLVDPTPFEAANSLTRKEWRLWIGSFIPFDRQGQPTLIN